MVKMKVSRIFFTMKIFRIAELCFVISLILWLSLQLPLVVKISSEYFRQLVVVLLHPFIIFVTFNFIIFILLFKSSSLFSNNVANETELNDSFLDFPVTGNCFQVPEIVYEDKEIVVEKEKENVMELEKVESENVEEISLEKSCRKVKDSGEISPEIVVAEVEELSNEEFQKTIEEFIAKQIKFHRQEKVAIVLHSNAKIVSV